MICKKCHCEDVEFRQNGPHVAAYCKDCGAFIKFATKTEVEEYTRLTSMTNFEWLKSLSLEKFAHTIFYHNAAQGRSLSAFIDWLEANHTKKTEV